jgi:hypothetical protein
MLRIVGIQRSERVSEEFILLQNQCSMRLKLKGHVLMTENRVVAENEGFVHIFDQDELIHSGAFCSIEIWLRGFSVGTHKRRQFGLHSFSWKA